MENNTNLNIEAGVSTEPTTTESVTVNTASDEMISMSKIDYEKALQGAEDRIRGAKSKEIKALQSKLDALTPAEKSQSDIELENRLAAIEAREKATAVKEQMINLQATLSAKGLDKGLANYLKSDSDIDIDAFTALIDGMINERTKGYGYVPTGHQSNVGMTADEWRKMPYSQQAELILKNPEYENMFKRK